MRKLKAAIDIGTLVSAVLLIVVLGALMYTVTDSVTWNASRNGSGAMTAMGALLPLLIIIAVVVSLLSFSKSE